MSAACAPHGSCTVRSPVRPTLPLTAVSVGALDDESVQDWDQFILRFTKLQDAIGNRLFPSLLDYLLEPSAEQPMIDKINRLEKLDFIERADRPGATRTWSGLALSCSARVAGTN